MNDPFSLSVQLTHKYNAGWSHLDESHHLGECRVTASKERKSDDRGESFSQLLIVETDTGSSKYRPRNIIRAIHDTFQSSCRCQHDCCGHISTYVRKARHLCGNRYAVLLGGSRNV